MDLELVSGFWCKHGFMNNMNKSYLGRLSEALNTVSIRTQDCDNCDVCLWIPNSHRSGRSPVYIFLLLIWCIK